MGRTAVDMRSSQDKSGQMYDWNQRDLRLSGLPNDDPGPSDEQERFRSVLESHWYVPWVAKLSPVLVWELLSLEDELAGRVCA